MTNEVKQSIITRFRIKFLLRGRENLEPEDIEKFILEIAEESEKRGYKEGNRFGILQAKRVVEEAMKHE